MIDIETTGTNKDTDDVLEIGIVPITLDDDGFWETGIRDYNNEVVPWDIHLTLHSKRQPTNIFAIEHMGKLYKKCNEQPESQDYSWATDKIRNFIHAEGAVIPYPHRPKFFMGWNASNFDCEFLIQKGILEGSKYVEIDGKEVLTGDIHYRIYEQTGALNLLLNSTGLSKKSLFALGGDLIPEHIKCELPLGKKHDALYDCYEQINTMNGMIAIAKKGWIK